MENHIALKGLQSIQCSLAHHFHNHPFVPLAVKFRIENPLPGAQIKLSRSDGNDHLMVDQQSFQVRIALSSPVS